MHTLLLLLHSARRRCNERKVSEARGFVDGDLVEALLDLSPADARKVGGRDGGWERLLRCMGLRAPCLAGGWLDGQRRGAGRPATTRGGALPLALKHEVEPGWA